MSLFVGFLEGLFAWIQYTFDPEMVKRRDLINLELLKGKNRDEIDRILGTSNTVGLGYFISESVRILRSEETNNSTGRRASILDRIAPKPTDGSGVHEDTETGFDR